MSKKFKTQDYFRYPRLKNKWRRPKGLQSKLRLKKGGSGMLVSIGYGTKDLDRHTISGMKYAVVSNVKQLGNTDAKAVVISSGTGGKKSLEIAAKAKELGIKVLNMKKVRKSERVEKKIASKKAPKTDEKKEEKKKEKKIGFDEDVVPQVLGGKTKTYRLRDHGLKVGDKVVFENTQKGEKFGHAKITKVEKVPVEKFNLKDPEHYVVYNSMEELVEALRKRNPDKEVTPKTEMFAYTYEFAPLKEEK